MERRTTTGGRKDPKAPRQLRRLASNGGRGGKAETRPGGRCQGHRPLQEAHQSHHRAGDIDRLMDMKIQGADAEANRRRLPSGQGAAAARCQRFQKDVAGPGQRPSCSWPAMEATGRGPRDRAAQPADFDPFKVEIPKVRSPGLRFDVEVRPSSPCPTTRDCGSAGLSTLHRRGVAEEERRHPDTLCPDCAQAGRQCQIGHVIVADGTTKDGGPPAGQL